MADGRVWLVVQEALVEGQCDDNDADVFYNTKVKSCKSIKVILKLWYSYSGFNSR